MLTTQHTNDMLDRLRAVVCRGTFEAHVTVEADDLDRRERFRALCAGLGVKCVLIELARGQTRSQPMTSSYHRGELEDVAREVADLAASVQAAGFPVSRVKLEAVITNTGLPQTDAEALAFPVSNYFEFHVKALLSADADLDALRILCERHRAHLSSNALKRDADGRSERFVTQRAYGVGRTTAEAAFERLIAELSAAGYALSNKLREYTLFDSNVAVDAGWIDGPEDEDE